MKKIIYLFAATLVLTAAGCDKQSTNENEVQYISELRVNFEGDTRLSATHDASGLKFQWSEYDNIYIFDAKNTDADAKEYQYDPETGAFIPSTENYNLKPYLEAGKEYFALLGESGAMISNIDNNPIIVTGLEDDDGIQGIPMITDVFKATADGTIATLHHIAGVVEIPVKAASEGTYLMNLTLDSKTSGVPMAGNFKVSPVAPYKHTWYDDEPSYFSQFWAEDDANCIYIESYDDSSYYIYLSTNKTTSIFIPVLPGTYSTIDIKYKLFGEPEKTINTNHELVVERGKITKISTITLEKSF